MRKEPASACEYHVSTHEGTDTFVGICSDGARVRVCFPMGYRLGETDAERKQDAQLLIRVLSRFSRAKERLLPRMTIRYPEPVEFPIQAYMTVLKEYNDRGYYTERECVFAVNGRGSRSWSRTIKTQRAYPQEDSFVYLTPVARKSRADAANYLTKIHEFCVYEAYCKIGFLFSVKQVRKPSIPFDRKRFIIALREKLRNENRDRNKALFAAMLDMIQYMGQTGQAADFFFGTHRFEYVWERLIDFCFGESDKALYFPRAAWYLGESGKRTLSALEPDTVMKSNGRVFILDAKYYRYGVRNDPAELPQSASVNKQITYGEYVATAPKFRDANGQAPQVYNAFLMPFDQSGQVFPSEKPVLRIGEARGEWKNGSGNPYERVQGILLDMKWMMTRTVRHHEQDISQLAQLIEDAVEKTSLSTGE